MSLLRIITSADRPPPPPKPPETQVIPCQPGYSGAGQTQTRVCTLRTSDNTWHCTDWATISSSCTIDTFTFYGPSTDWPMVGYSEENPTPPPLYNRIGTMPPAAVYDPTAYIQSVKLYDYNLSANGYTAHIKAWYLWGPQAIGYEVWCPALAGRTVLAHWTEDSYKGPPSNWHAPQVLDANGYTAFYAHSEPEYGYGPPCNIKNGEYNACNIDVS